MGSDSASSAQSKCGGAGIVERGSTELDGLLTRDGGCKTGAVGSSDVPATVEDAGVGETGRLGLIWGEPGGTGFVVGVDGERGLGLGFPIIVWAFFENTGDWSRCGTISAAECWRWRPSSSLGIEKAVLGFLNGL